MVMASLEAINLFFGKEKVIDSFIASDEFDYSLFKKLHIKLTGMMLTNAQLDENDLAKATFKANGKSMLKYLSSITVLNIGYDQPSISDQLKSYLNS